MKVWFLVLILGTGDPEITRTVAIRQPDELSCLKQLNSFVYTTTEHGDDVREHRVLDKVCQSGDEPAEEVIYDTA